MNDCPISPSQFLLGILVGIIAGIYTNYLAATDAGVVISVALTGFIVCVALLKFKSGVELFLFSVLVMPMFPRDLIEGVTGGGEEEKFCSLMFSQFAGLSLAAWLILILALVAIFKRGFRIGITNPILTCLIAVTGLVIGSMYLATLLDIPIREAFYLKDIVSDHRFFIILFSSVFVAARYTQLNSTWRLDFVRILMLIAIACGTRTIFLFINDQMTGVMHINFSPVPYLLYPFIFCLMQSYRFSLKTIALLFFAFFGAFSISRSDLFLAMLLGLIFVLSNAYRGNWKQVAKIGWLASFVGVMVLSLFIFNERALGFLAFKMNFMSSEIVSGELSKSPAVRLYEFKNILSEESETLVPLVIGKGFGSTLNYRRHPIPFELDTSAYTQRDLDRNRFSMPHTFLNYTLLKGGLVFFTYYVALLFLLFVLGFKPKPKDIAEDNFITGMATYFSVFAINIYWQIHLIFIFGLLLVFLILERKPEFAPDPVT